MTQRMTFKDAIKLVDPDLPDGAFWALAHEIAGLEYGEGFAELSEGSLNSTKTHQCHACKKWLRGEQGLRDHQEAAHPEMKPKTRARHLALAARR